MSDFPPPLPPPSPGKEADTARLSSIGAGLNVNLTELEGATNAVAGLKGAIAALQTTLSNFSSSQMAIAGINAHLASIGTTAQTVTGQLTTLSAAVAAVGAGGTGGGGGGTGTGTVTAPATTTTTSGASSWVNSASTAINSVLNKNLAGGISLGSFVGTKGGDDATGFLADMALAPIRYLRSRIDTNRDTALMASGGLNMRAMQQGTGTAGMMTTMSKFPGNIYGSPQDLIDLFGTAPSLGASYGFGGSQGQGVRAQGFLKGIQQMQVMNPLAQVSDLTQQLGSYSGNTQAQQAGVMYTGGAMSMIGAGGRQKSLSEWAESILTWFEGLRPGAQRNKPFDYGTLMAQYFPGSNIDAWFNLNQVPQNMRDYWWTYVLGKASKSPTGTTAGPEVAVEADPNNVAWQRLKASSELTRTEFGLAGQMAPQYAQREASNRWFNQLMGKIQTTIIPALTGSIMSFVQYLPDSLEDLLMTGVERGAGALLGGDVPNSAGDIGDAGGYGAMGGTGLSGLHPDMKSKVGAMMRANPRLRMTSGLRDTGLQTKLRAAGNMNVSGKPSAHTRGTAADLGPSSQYGWIAKNAKRFGLASGIGHGEPWHVGMRGDIPGTGDVGDVGDIFDSLGTIKDALEQLGNGPTGMAAGVTELLGMLLGGLGKFVGGTGSSTPSDINPDTLFDQLAAASKNVNLKGIQSPVLGATSGGTLGPVTPGGGGSASGGATGSAPGTASGWGGDGRVWRGTNPSGRGDKYNEVASADIMSGIASNDAATRGAAVATALSNAGFSGDVLRKMVEISYRESRWKSTAWNSGPKDESGGILSANQLPWTKDGKIPPFTQADTWDPQAAAYIAYDQYKNVAPVNGPGGHNTFSPWTVGGDPLGGLPVGTAALTDSALHQAGLGDIEQMRASINMTGGGGGGGGNVMHFSNVFNLSAPTSGGSNGGIDIRRTVALLADQLEGEMNRRLKRSA